VTLCVDLWTEHVGNRQNAGNRNMVGLVFCVVIAVPRSNRNGVPFPIHQRETVKKEGIHDDDDQVHCGYGTVSREALCAWNGRKWNAWNWNRRCQCPSWKCRGDGIAIENASESEMDGHNVEEELRSGFWI